MGHIVLLTLPTIGLLLLRYAGLTTVSTSMLLLILCFVSTPIRRLIRTLPRDIKGFYRLRRLQRQMDQKWAEDRPIGWHFLRNVHRSPDKVCLIEADTGRSLTFSELNSMANTFGNYFQDKLLPSSSEHDAPPVPVLGLFLPNCAEFVAVWLGLAKLGLPSAWINTQLKMASLAHSVQVAKCSAVVATPELLPSILEAISVDLLPSIKVYCINGAECQLQSDTVTFLDQSQLCNVTEPRTERKIGFQDTLAYLYTSGTTGAPKAVVIRHHRYYFMGIAGPTIYGIRPEDRVYIPLPMYHGMGGIAGVSQMVVNGSSVVIRSKFSASEFWHDCVCFDASVALYIGELCRYLLARPVCPWEGQHNIRLFCGLGLRPRIWRAFRQRFGVREIGELYGATEGNATLVNITYRTGACGFWPVYSTLMAKSSMRLVKIDPISGEYLRNANGTCMLCRPGDTGEIVGMIRDGNPIRRFEGYLDKEETEKKIVRDVEAMGDRAFASGDLLHWDAEGYLYFKDRRGDTYRWRGENVSSTEVEGILQDIVAIEDLAVYGVRVPEEEGRAGMVAIALADGTTDDTEQLLELISERFHQNLLQFAIPIFLRLCGHIQRTGTYKLQKGELRDQGFGLSGNEEDTVYIWSRNRKRYRLIGRAEREELIRGEKGLAQVQEAG